MCMQSLWPPLLHLRMFACGCLRWSMHVCCMHARVLHACACACMHARVHACMRVCCMHVCMRVRTHALRWSTWPCALAASDIVMDDDVGYPPSNHAFAAASTPARPAQPASEGTERSRSTAAASPQLSGDGDGEGTVASAQSGARTPAGASGRPKVTWMEKHAASGAIVPDSAVVVLLHPPSSLNYPEICFSAPYDRL